MNWPTYRENWILTLNDYQRGNYDLSSIDRNQMKLLNGEETCFGITVPIIRSHPTSNGDTSIWSVPISDTDQIMSSMTMASCNCIKIYY
jgi:hypothetical protein